MGITREQLRGMLKIACLPDIRLSDAEAEEWLIRECAGMAVCIIDSLRATILGCDENDSSVRAFLDKLLRVSEVTGCTFLLIHHAGKGRGEGDQREAGRGSSAIFDAAGTVLKMTAVEHDEPGVTIARVVMTKSTADADGGAIESFCLRIEDVADDAGVDMKWGLRCVYQTRHQVEPPKSEDCRFNEVCDRVLRVIAAKPGASGRYVRGRIEKVREATILSALETLQSAGRIANTGTERAAKWEAVSGTTDASD